MKHARVDHAEVMRRLRLGDICTLLRDRWGAAVPPDDAGRDDLRLLLLYVSAGPNAFLKMPRTIEVWAPWMPPHEAEELIDEVNRTPHLPTARQLGEELRVTNAIRERLMVWRVLACDMTARQRREWRRQKERERDRRRRELRGAKAHSSSSSRTKPWKLAGFKCRRTWERHGKPAACVAKKPAELCRKKTRDNTSLRTAEEFATSEQAVPPQELATDGHAHRSQTVKLQRSRQSRSDEGFRPGGRAGSQTGTRDK